MPGTALVTGATGFIGNHLSKRLVQEGYHVVGIGTRGENSGSCHTMLHCQLDELVVADLPHIDVCFHQAANNDTMLDSNMAMCDANVVRPTRLFNRLLESGCRRFVYASSCSVYGKSTPPFSEATAASPLNAYAKSKLMFDNHMKKFFGKNGVTAVGLRYTNVYGPGEEHKGRRASMAYQMAKSCLAGKTVSLFRPGDQMRDWVYVDDVVDANMLAAGCDISAVANIGLGTSYSFKDVADAVSMAVGRDLAISWTDCPFESQYQSHTAVDVSLAKRIFGYEPKTGLQSGIAKMVEKMKGPGPDEDRPPLCASDWVSSRS